MALFDKDMVSRRGFIGAAAGVGALMATGVEAGQSYRGRDGQGGYSTDASRFRRRSRVGVQLYSVRGDCAKDLAGTIEKVAKMGYQGVEFAGYYGHSAKDIKKMLDDNGIVCCGTHTGMDTLLDDKLAETIEYNKILGNKYLIVPGLAGQYRESRQAWLKTAELFNEISAKVKPEGMLVGYHNHSVEFQPMDGEMPWDTFYGNTVEDVVMQIDTGNCMHGGQDPLPYLYKYPGRAITVHCKEFSKTNNKALVGEGDIPWRAFFALCRAVGNTEWYIVEQESYAASPLESIDKCLQNLREMRLVYLSNPTRSRTAPPQ